jgi:hypothetical protein
MSQSQKFASNLLHYFLTRRSSKVKVQKNTFPVLSDEAMSIYSDQTDENDLFGENHDSVVKYMGQQLAAIRLGGEATIKIDGYTYVFHRYPNKTGIIVTRHKKIDAKKLNPDYQALVTIDPAKFEKMFLRIAADIPRDSFLMDKKKDASFKAVILSDDVAEFCDPAFLDLCEQFPEAFTSNQLNEIAQFRQCEFDNFHATAYNRDLNRMFKNWFPFLVAKNATVDKPFVFNDSDNYAYFEENDIYQLMVQKSQNTIYVYIREKSTKRIKVWNSCAVFPSSECDLDSYSKEKYTYLDAVTNVMKPYSYDIYYANLDHLDSYLKTPSYYFNNFNIEFGIIYDTARGYKINSAHAQNAMSDFTLLNDILKYYEDDDD